MSFFLVEIFTNGLCRIVYIVILLIYLWCSKIINTFFSRLNKKRKFGQEISNSKNICSDWYIHPDRQK